jgi:alkanesulfonate monooxygenase SsuD/methylene tetrahydromethanopterin reductase-like flavin-dependent oxidoreductase (luciferase family)
MLLSMGFGPDNVRYIRSLIEEGCAAFGRKESELELWWNSEVVFGESVDAARNRGIGVGTEWLTMGRLEGKQIPEELLPALLEYNKDVHDLGAEYQDEDRERALIDRAKELGLYDWLMSRAPGLWGTPRDIATRLHELEAQGMDRWMFYVGRRESDRMNHLRLICSEVLPLLRR